MMVLVSGAWCQDGEWVSPVGRARGGAPGGGTDDVVVVRRQGTGGVGVGRVAGEQGGLAAAAAEVDVAAGAAPARLRHPGRAAIAVERLRLLPDPAQRPPPD